MKSYFLNPLLNFILCTFNPVFFSFYILIRKKSYISLALPSHVLLEFKYDLQCLNRVLLQLTLKRSFSPVEGQCSCCIVLPSWHLLCSIFIILNRIIHMSVTNIGMLHIFIVEVFLFPQIYTNVHSSLLYFTSRILPFALKVTLLITTV